MDDEAGRLATFTLLAALLLLLLIWLLLLVCRSLEDASSLASRLVIVEEKRDGFTPVSGQACRSPSRETFRFFHGGIQRRHHPAVEMHLCGKTRSRRAETDTAHDTRCAPTKLNCTLQPSTDVRSAFPGGMSNVMRIVR